MCLERCRNVRLAELARRASYRANPCLPRAVGSPMRLPLPINARRTQVVRSTVARAARLASTKTRREWRTARSARPTSTSSTPTRPRAMVVQPVTTAMRQWRHTCACRGQARASSVLRARPRPTLRLHPACRAVGSNFKTKPAKRSAKRALLTKVPRTGYRVDAKPGRTRAPAAHAWTACQANSRTAPWIVAPTARQDRLHRPRGASTAHHAHAASINPSTAETGGGSAD